MRPLLLSLLIAPLIHVVGMSVSAQDPHPRDEIRQELQAQKEKLDKILHEIEDKHLQAVREAEKAAVEELKTLARSKAGSGNIKEATEAWTEVIKLDSTDPDANKFFRAIGREDIVQQEIVKAIERQSPEPTKRVEWRSDGNTVYRLQSNGVWLQLYQDKDGLHQKPHVETSRTPYFIELFYDGGSHKQFKRLYGDRMFWRYANEQEWTNQNNGQWVD